MLSAEEQQIVELVATWVDDRVRPVARELEHANTYPDGLIEQMKSMGVYGLTVPQPYGDSGVSRGCFARVTEEVARGWMSLAGAFGGHSVVCTLLVRFGTDEQRRRYLPRLATGELRATMALTEPDGGSDLQAMRTVARPVADGYVINGSKTWISNARRSGLVALLAKTDPDAEPRHRGVSILLVEPSAGFTISRDLPKLGYKGVEACELHFDDCPVPADAVLGGAEGKGFAQMMAGLEVGRIQVAGRAIGVARAAFDDALRYAQDRETFGVAIWRHQSVGNLLADMATQISAGQQLNYHAADCVESGRRADLEASMAKLFCFGDGGQGHARRGAHPRRPRLLHRVRRRALLPRRSLDDRGRGHQRGVAHGHRQTARRAPGPGLTRTALAYAAAMERFEPVTPDNVDDLDTLFATGDPRTCQCAFMRLSNAAWSAASPGERRAEHRRADRRRGRRRSGRRPHRLPRRRAGRLGELRPAGGLRPAVDLTAAATGRRPARVVGGVLRHRRVGPPPRPRRTAPRRRRRLRP